jgi:hypothetical protein
MPPGKTNALRLLAQSFCLAPFEKNCLQWKACFALLSI